MSRGRGDSELPARPWKSFFALSLGGIASILNRAEHRPATDLVVKFFDHFVLVADALDRLGLYDESDGFYYDRLRLLDGTEIAVEVHSMVGIIPMLASGIVDQPRCHRSRVAPA